MDKKPALPPKSKFELVMQRIVAAIAVTVVFAGLTAFVPNNGHGRSIEPEITLSLVVVGYGTALIGVCRGLFDHDLF
jgi:hypothetical protein